MPQLIYLCSLLPIPVLAVTAIVMYRRKQHRLYPVFWPYLIFQLSRVTVEVIIYPISQTFFFTLTGPPVPAASSLACFYCEAFS